jgi:hypothetical protein
MSRGTKKGLRAATLAALLMLLLSLAVVVAACGGNASTSTTAATATTAVDASATVTTVGGPVTTMAPPTTTASGDASTTATTVAAATTVSLPTSLSDADKTFVKALATSVQGHTQEMLDLGAFTLSYETAKDADIAKAEEDVKKIGAWVSEVKAMTPSEGLKDVHRVLSEALDQYLQGFTAFVAAVKAKDAAQIKAAMTIISEASKKFQSFGQAFGGLMK